MLILGVDTSGKNGSIALARFENEKSHAFEVVPLEGGTFSAQLVPQISSLLAQHNLTNRDIDGFAVVSGPGSFTGLRVGLAAIKALAEVTHKPIAAISLLEAVARAYGAKGNVLAALDAGRGELYVADFRITANEVVAGEQRLATTGEAFASGDEVVTPDLKIAELATQYGLRVQQIPYPKADLIARLGFEKITRGDTVSALDLDANYIRRSDAEIKFSAR